MTRRLIAFAVMALWLVLAVPVARADTGDIISPQLEKPNRANDGWQAGTCWEDDIANQCSPESPISQFFRIAAGHPPFGFTQYIVKQEEIPPPGSGLFIPIGPVKTIHVDLPPGLTVNPQATETRCTMAQFNTALPPAQGEGPSCPASSQVGEERLTVKIIAGPDAGTAVPPSPGATRVPLYNLQRD
jgi:hypothetical protein